MISSTHHRQDHLSLGQIAHSPVYPDFEHSQWWGIPNFSWQPCSQHLTMQMFQHLTTFIIKKIFLVSNLNLSFNLKLLPCVVSLQALVKCFSLSLSLLYVLNDSSKVSPKPSFLQTEQSHLFHPFLIGEVFQPSEHFGDPPVDALGQVCALGTLELDTALGEGFSREQEEGEDPLPCPAAPASLPAAWDTAVFLTAAHTLPWCS